MFNVPFAELASVPSQLALLLGPKKLNAFVDKRVAGSEFGMSEAREDKLTSTGWLVGAAIPSMVKLCAVILCAPGASVTVIENKFEPSQMPLPAGEPSTPICTTTWGSTNGQLPATTVRA